MRRFSTGRRGLLLFLLVTLAFAEPATGQPQPAPGEGPTSSITAADLAGWWSPIYDGVARDLRVVARPDASGLVVGHETHPSGSDPHPSDWVFRIDTRGDQVETVVHTWFEASCWDSCPDLCEYSSSATAEMSADRRTLTLVYEQFLLDEDCSLSPHGFGTAVFHRISPIDELLFTSVDGSLLDHLDSSTPFRVRANLALPADDTQIAVLDWGTGKRAVQLYATEVENVYESPTLVLDPADETGEARGLGRMPSTVPPDDGGAHLLAGTWDVTHVDLELAGLGRDPMTGTATVSPDGGDVTVRIDGPDGRTTYRSVEVSASEFALIARFVQDSGDEPRAGLQLPIPVETTELSASLQGAGATVAVTPPAPWMIYRASLRVRSGGGRLAGMWFLETTADGLPSENADQTWSRGTHISGVVDVTTDLRGYATNHLVQSGRNSRATRVLFVHGMNLPVSTSDARILETLSEDATYRYLGDATDDAEAWEMAGVERGEHATAMLVEASLDAHAALGGKSLRVNGAEGTWILDNPRVPARMAFVWAHADASPTGSLTAAPLDRAYGEETLFVEIDLVAPILADEIAVFPLLDDEPIRLPVEIGGQRHLSDPVQLTARRTLRHDGAERLEFRTEPIRLWRTDGPHGEPPGDPGVLILGVEQGAVLAAITDPRRVTTVPARPEVLVELDPASAGRLWRDALDRVAACPPGSTIDDYADFASDPGHVHDPFLLTSLADNSITLTHGDHAALLLIRDEFLRQMRGTGQIGDDPGLIQLYQERAEASDEVLAGYRAEVLRTGEAERDAFWQVMTATMPDPDHPGSGSIEYLLVDTLDLDALLLGTSSEHKYGMTRAELEQWAVDQTRRALEQYVEDMGAATRRSYAAGDCNLTELLVVGGQDADSLIAGLMPQLVKTVTAGDPPRSVVVPDRLAQGYVADVRTAAAAIRALDEYKDIDEQYQSMALAVAGSFTGFGFAAVAARLGTVASTSVTAYRASRICRAASWMAAEGVEAYDAYNSVKDYLDVVEANDRLQAARGAAALLGEQHYREAQGRSGDALWTLIGALAPTVAGKIPDMIRTPLMLQRVLDEMVEPDRVLRGAELARGNLSKAAIDAMSDDQRLDLAAWAAHQRLTTPSGGAATLPPPAERLALADIENATLPPPSRQVDSWGIPGSDGTGDGTGTWVDAPGNATRPPPPNGGGSGNSGSVPGPDAPRDDPRTYADADTAFPGREAGSPPDPMAKTFIGKDLEPLADWIHGAPLDPHAETVGRSMLPGIPNPPPLPAGEYHVLTRHGDVVNIDLGTRIGKGSFNEVYVNATPLVEGEEATTLFRLSQVVENGTNPSIRMDAVGREALASVDGNAVTTVKVHAAMELIEPDGTLRRLEVIDRFDPTWHKVELGDRMTPGQAIAFDRATRELNGHGYVWLDGHHGNYVFEPLEGTDEWRLCIFDPGGIVPVREVDDPAALARLVQREVNVPRPGESVDWLQNAENPNKYHLHSAAEEMRARLAPILDRALDPRSIGFEKTADFTHYNPAGAVRHHHVHELFDAEDPAAAYDALRASASSPS